MYMKYEEDEYEEEEMIDEFEEIIDKELAEMPDDPDQAIYRAIEKALCGVY